MISGLQTTSGIGPLGRVCDMIAEADSRKENQTLRIWLGALFFHNIINLAAASAGEIAGLGGKPAANLYNNKMPWFAEIAGGAG
jgi:hypothetical protein